MKNYLLEFMEFYYSYLSKNPNVEDEKVIEIWLILRMELNKKKCPYCDVELSEKDISYHNYINACPEHKRRAEMDTEVELAKINKNVEDGLICLID